MIRWLRNKSALVGVAALVLVAAWELLVLWRAHAHAPADGDWQAAAREIEIRYQPGDLIVFAPGWVDPVGRRWLGHLMTIEDAARMDAARYGRVWEVSIRGARAREVRGEQPMFVARFGRVRIRQFVRPAPKVSWDLRARSRLVEVDYAPRLCVPLRPPGKLDVGEIPLGAELVVYAGLADFRARKENRAWATVRVLVDGKEADTISLGSSWTRMTIPTTPGLHRVVFESGVAASWGKVNLDLCVAAEARTPQGMP